MGNQVQDKVKDTQAKVPDKVLAKVPASNDAGSANRKENVNSSKAAKNKKTGS